MKLTTGSIDFFDISEPELTGVTIKLGGDEHVLSSCQMFLPEEREYDSQKVAAMLRDLADVLERA
jgi:hypothetical protein